MKKLYTKAMALAAGLFLLIGQSNAQVTIFSENWAAGSFTTNGWTFPNGQPNWLIGNAYIPAGASAPTAYFNYSPPITNYSVSLLSNTINATSFPAPVLLDYLLLLDNFSSSTVENFKVEYKTTGSSTWNLVAAYTSTMGDQTYPVSNFTLNGVAGQSFQLRFTAYGPNSNNLNAWSIDNIVVKGPPCIPTLSASIAGSSCSGSSRTLTATGSDNYTWNPGNLSGASVVVNPTASTIYTLSSTNTTVGCVQTFTLLAPVTATTPLSISAPGYICPGSSAILSVSGATSYVWNTGATTNTISVSPTVTTVYSVTGTNSNGCSTSGSVSISANGPTLTAGHAYLCGPTGSATLTAISPGNSISWYSSPTSTTALATGNSYAVPTVTGNTTFYAQALSSGSSLNSIFTTTAAGNGASGNMFDVVPANNITWTGVDMSIQTAGTHSVEIWYRSGTFVGFESSNAGWTQLLSTTVTAQGTGTLTNVSGFAASLTSGQTYGLYVTISSGSGVNYTNGTTLGATFVSNADIAVKEGKGGGYFSVVNTPRVFNGRLYYQLPGGSGSCTGPMTAVTASVNANPTVSAAGPGTICVNQQATLTATGANTYTWNTFQTGSSIATSPTVNTTYTVTGANGNCSATATVAVVVDQCVGIAENHLSFATLSVYPNPNNGEFTFQLVNGMAKTLQVCDLTGRIVKEIRNNEDEFSVNLTGLSNGVYYIKVLSNNATAVVKVIKQ